MDELQEKVVKVLEDESLGEAEKVLELNHLGLDNADIVKIGFAKSTVYKVLPINPKGKGVVEEKGNGVHLPAVLKAGKGETITPEGIMSSYLLHDGVEGELMLKGMMLYRAAQLAVLTDVEIMKGQADAQAKMVKPILDMMVETRKEQDAAAERARASSADIAEQAAYQASAEVARAIAPELQGIRSAVAGHSGDPLARVVSTVQSAQ